MCCALAADTEFGLAAEAWHRCDHECLLPLSLLGLVSMGASGAGRQARRRGAFIPIGDRGHIGEHTLDILRGAGILAFRTAVLRAALSRGREVGETGRHRRTGGGWHCVTEVWGLGQGYRRRHVQVVMNVQLRSVQKW